MPPWQRVGGHINLPLSVHSSRYRYMVCPAISSYSFGATALIFCMMFIHIMEVDLFIISYGQAGASFVSYRRTSFLKNHSYQNNFVHNYQVRGHTSFLVLILFLDILGLWFFMLFWVFRFYIFQSVGIFISF